MTEKDAKTQEFLDQGKRKLIDQIRKGRSTAPAATQQRPDETAVQYLERKLTEATQRNAYLEDLVMRFIQHALATNELVALVTGEADDQAADNPDAATGEQPHA